MKRILLALVAAAAFTVTVGATPIESSSAEARPWVRAGVYGRTAYRPYYSRGYYRPYGGYYGRYSRGYYGNGYYGSGYYNRAYYGGGYGGYGYGYPTGGYYYSW